MISSSQNGNAWPHEDESFSYVLPGRPKRLEAIQPPQIYGCVTMVYLGALVKFLHDVPSRTPALIKASLVHVQFETIHPITTVAHAVSELGLTAPTVRGAIQAMEKRGIVREISGKRRDRVYVYDRYLKILDKGTELQ